MNKINEIIKASNCINGGNKEAAIKVRAVLRNISMANENILLLGKSGLGAEEFLEAVCKLVAYAETGIDEKVELWRCETDCVRAPNPNCLYRQLTFSNGTKTCPHYIEEDK